MDNLKRRNKMSKILKGSISLFTTFCTGLFLLINGSLADTDLDNGKSVYEARCMFCHGIAGDGNGPAAGGLSPKPTNFTDSTVMSQLTTTDIERAIVQGKLATEMKGFGNILSNEEVRNVITYIRTFQQ
jgi:mono/diheme cytochrome c family protein